MLKCNNDFGRTVLNIGKNAKASIEILDNKVMHEICAERFDINVAEGAELEIFFANPANDLPLTFRHFDIKQAAHSTVHFANVLQDAGIGRISARVELNERRRRQLRLPQPEHSEGCSLQAPAPDDFAQRPRNGEHAICS